MDHLPFLHNVACEVAVDDAPVPLCCRYPADVRDQINDGAKARALNAAGVEFRARVGEAGACLTLHIAGNTAQQLEVSLGDHALWSFLAGPGEHRIPLPEKITFPWFNGRDAREQLAACPRRRFAPDLLRIAFPHGAAFGVLSLEGDCSPARPEDLPKRRLLCYGSSITQGFASLSCGNSYAARLADALGCDLLNFGSGGSAHCEAAMAEYIASRRDWDIATLEMGINMPGFSEEDFQERVQGMVSRIAGPAQQRPVFCLDMFRHFCDLPEHDGGKAQRFRAIVADAVEELGGAQCRHLPIRHLPSWSGLGADLLHPGMGGMEEMAQALARVISSEIA